MLVVPCSLVNTNKNWLFFAVLWIGGWVLIFKWDININFIISEAQEHNRRGGRKNVRVRGRERLEWCLLDTACLLLTWTLSNCGYLYKAYTWLSQPKFQHWWETRSPSPSLPDELLAVDTCCGTENHTCWWCSHWSFPVFQWIPYMCAHMTPLTRLSEL